MAGLLLLLFMLFVALSIAKARRIERKRREAFAHKPQTILATAEFAGYKDAKQAGLFAKEGIPCGELNGRQMLYDGEAMAVSGGPVGCGKGVVQVTKAAFTMDSRTLAFEEPKGGAAGVAWDYRKKLGPCYSIAPWGGNGRPPSFHNPMDILSDPKQKVHFFANSRSIAESLAYDRGGTGNALFFNRSAIEMKHTFIMAVATEEPPQKRTLQRVLEIMRNDPYGYATKVYETTTDPVIRGAIAMYSNRTKRDEKTDANVLYTVLTNMAFLADPGVATYMSMSTFSYERGRQEVCTYFKTTPVNRQDVGTRFNFFETNLMLNRLLAPGKWRTRFTIILDDFASYEVPPEVERAIGISREFGVQLWIIFQDLSQLEAKTASYQSYLANAGIRCFFAPQDQKTASFVSEQIGETQVHGWSRSMSGEVDGEFQDGWGQGIHARPLMRPNEVRALPADRMFVFARGMKNVLIAKAVPYYKQARFWGKYSKNPMYKG